MTKISHGTISGYFYSGCRCDLCKAAGKEYRQQNPRIRGKKKKPSVAGMFTVLSNNELSILGATLLSAIQSLHEYAYENYPDTLDELTAEIAETHKELVGIGQHGSIEMYNSKCRCANCKEFYRVYMNKRKKRTRPVTARSDKSHNPNIKHGTNGGYTYHKCSCPPCKSANAKYKTALRQKTNVL
jgi:hypothetical protein